jgi:hypothetical protein
MFIKDGQPITLATGQVIDGVQIVLPLNAERLAELGITEVPDGPRPDDRFHYVGEQLPDGTYESIPKPRKDTDALVWSRIKSERDRRKAGGVKVGDKWFHSDDASRIQQMGLVMMGANLPAGLQWKTMDGSFITMTPSLAQQVFAAQAASDQAIFAHAEGLREALAASPDPAAFDYSTGWPAIYGE